MDSVRVYVFFPVHGPDFGTVADPGQQLGLVYG